MEGLPGAGVLRCDAGDQRDAFAYFHSLTDAPDCGQHVVPLAQLDADLSATDVVDTLPNLLWIVPGASAADLPSADTFVRTWAERLLASPAFGSGLLVVLFDASPPGPSPTDRRVGAVLVSRFVKPGTVVDDRYDHLNLLRTLAEAFGVPAPGGAGADEVAPFGRDVFSAWKTPSR